MHPKRAAGVSRPVAPVDGLLNAAMIPTGVAPVIA